MGKSPPQKRFVRDDRELIGDLSTKIMSTLESVLMADYVHTESQIPRTRELPRNEK